MLMAVAVLAACGKNEGDTAVETTPGEILFRCSTGATRGEAVEGPTLAVGERFGVYAFLLPEQGGLPGSSGASAVGGYMNNSFIPVTVASGGCTYSPVASWPVNVNDRLKFFAYYPYAADINGNVSQGTDAGKDPYMKITYKADQDPKNHIDLMYATTGDISRIGVQINLKHALTRVSFSAQAAKSNSAKPATVKIKSLDLYGVADNGTLTVAADGTPSWEIGAYTPSAPTYAFSQANNVIKNIDIPEKVNDSDVLYEDIIKESNGSIMMIPQSTENLVLSVVLTIDYDNGSSEEEKNFFLPLQNVNWNPGEHINYRLTVARDVINITANIRAWEKKDGPELPMD